MHRDRTERLWFATMNGVCWYDGTCFNPVKDDGISGIQVNCGALPEVLIDSELFGHERGAFTGAVSRRLGKVELATVGTLFLDEIGDMSLETQARLLRILEEPTFERVGGNRTLTLQTRIVAATRF